MSKKRSSQSSSHVLVNPSLNRTSRLWRMLTVVIRSSKAIYSAQSKYGYCTDRTENCQRLSDAICRTCTETTHQKPSSDLQPKRPTVGEWDKCSSIVHEVRLRYRIREIHRPLSNKPPLGPELVSKGAEVSRVPMQRESVDRHGRPFREVANAGRSAWNI